MDPLNTTTTKRRLATVGEAMHYSVKQYSRLGNRTSMYRSINAGHVCAFKFNGRTLIDLDSIDQLFNNLPRITPKPAATDRDGVRLSATPDQHGDGVVV